MSVLFQYNLNFKYMEEKKSYWRKWYLTVFVFLIIQILAYYIITIHFK